MYVLEESRERALPKERNNKEENREGELKL